MRNAVVTPARNEAANLGRLAAALAAQTMQPQIWIVVDNGSTDGTLELARELAERYEWACVLTIPGGTSAERGAPIVRALEAGIEALAEDPPDIVVNVDADISFEPDYFELLLARFLADPSFRFATTGRKANATEAPGGRAGTRA